MDHRALVNVVAFVIGFLCMVCLGVATAAQPVVMWHTLTYPDSWHATPEEATDSTCWVFYADHATLEYRGEHRVINISGPTDMSGSGLCSVYRRSDGTFYQESSFPVYGAERCWDTSAPVSGVCPEPPDCPVGDVFSFSVPGDSLIPLCRSGCRWENSGVGVCAAGSCFSEYTSTGDVCTVGPPGTPLSDGTEWIDSPEAQTTTDDPAPVTDGDTVTDQRTVTTQTDEAVKRDTVNNQTTVTETSVHGVTKTTTTTTTTHADGSQTITETVSYQRTDPTITTTRVGSGGSVTIQPGGTVTGSRTTTSVVGADGSVTSTTTETGVGGDGEGGPEDESGECGILPQIVCDFLSSDGEGEEHPGLPVEEVGGEMVAYDSGLGGGSCPGSVGTSFMGQSISYDYSDACYVATTYFRPILLAIAAIAAAFIIVGARL